LAIELTKREILNFARIAFGQFGSQAAVTAPLFEA
jgi:hypothetical protein